VPRAVVERIPARGVITMGKMDDARILTANMAKEIMQNFPAETSPDLWENVDPETEEWDKLKSLCMPSDGDEVGEVGFQLAASSRAGFLLGMQMTERALAPFMVEQQATARQATPVSSALQERGALEERYGAYFKRIEAANKPADRKRLLFEMDDIVGERLALEGDHAEEFRIVDAAAVQVDAEF
jgi:hypothetical protein